MPVRLDLTGTKFRLLTAIKPVGHNKKGRLVWLCKCDCGNETTVESTNLRSGHTGSCGCLVTRAKFTPEEHRQKKLAVTRRWRDRHPDRIVAYSRLQAVRNHGISESEWRALWTLQDGKCAICKRSFSPHDSGTVDHDHRCCPRAHSCGKCIRGLLCRACNRGIGCLHDNPEFLKAAIEYLESGGTRLIGDHIRQLKASEMVM